MKFTSYTLSNQNINGIKVPDWVIFHPGIGISVCGHSFPNAKASLVPDQGLAGLGGLNLNSLIGGSAYGIPRYVKTDLPCERGSIFPTTAPDSVCTTGENWLSSSSAQVNFDVEMTAQATNAQRAQSRARFMTSNNFTSDYFTTFWAIFAYIFGWLSLSTGSHATSRREALTRLFSCWTIF